MADLEGAERFFYLSPLSPYFLSPLPRARCTPLDPSLFSSIHPCMVSLTEMKWRSKQFLFALFSRLFCNRRHFSFALVKKWIIILDNFENPAKRNFDCCALTCGCKVWRTLNVLRHRQQEDCLALSELKIWLTHKQLRFLVSLFP